MHMGGRDSEMLQIAYTMGKLFGGSGGTIPLGAGYRMGKQERMCFSTCFLLNYQRVILEFSPKYGAESAAAASQN